MTETIDPLVIIDPLHDIVHLLEEIDHLEYKEVVVLVKKVSTIHKW